jgi:hypothetical protein
MTHLVRSVPAMVQYIASNLLPSDYRYYVDGVIPMPGNPDRLAEKLRAADEKLLAKFEVEPDRHRREHLKHRGRARARYLRYNLRWVVLATEGRNRGLDEDAALVKDIRSEPLHFFGYSISCRPDGKDPTRMRSSVRICEQEYRRLKRLWLERAHWDVKWFKEQLRWFLPYRPVIRRVGCLVRRVNVVRKERGLPLIDPEWVVTRRRSGKVFEED